MKLKLVTVNTNRDSNSHLWARIRKHQTDATARKNKKCLTPVGHTCKTITKKHSQYNQQRKQEKVKNHQPIVRLRGCITACAPLKLHKRPLNRETIPERSDSVSPPATSPHYTSHLLLELQDALLDMTTHYTTGGFLTMQT